MGPSLTSFFLLTDKNLSYDLLKKKTCNSSIFLILVTIKNIYRYKILNKIYKPPKKKKKKKKVAQQQKLLIVKLKKN